MGCPVLVELNPAQTEAVRYIDGPLLVLAGAGSGKTRVITQKVAHLIRACGYKPHHLAAVTFTNKAAREMKQRVGALMPGNEGRGLRVCTFHTLGLDILRREAARIGLRRGFSIFDDRDSVRLIQDLLRRGDDEADAVRVRQVRHRVSLWKNASVSPDGAASAAEDEQTLAAARAYTEYDRALRAYNAVDFDDLILLPLTLFRDNAEALATWQGKIRYLLVDEYQDTNACQYELVRRLVAGREALTVVGDDDQSIYAWRGAQPENLAQLTRDFPRLKIVKLEQNYRSTTRILRSANAVIANNAHVFDKLLWSRLGHGEPLRAVVCKDGDDEAERVVGELLHHKFQTAGAFSDYAILYRSNHQSKPFEKALREHDIPYQLSGGNSFFAHTEVKDVLAYMRLLSNPSDDAAFLRVVNVPRREIGAATLEKLGHYAASRRASLLAASTELGLESLLGQRALERLRRFVHWVGQLAQHARNRSPTGVMRQLLADLDYDAWLLDSSPDPRVAERRQQNVEELMAWLDKLARETEGHDLASLVAQMSLMDILERQNEERVGDQVTLMTLHAAKGLEFPHVFMVGMEEEILPHHGALAADDTDEERRLCYVGITRAQRTLTLTLARRRKRAGEWTVCEPSRFLDELVAEDVEWQGRGGPADPQKSRQRGNAHLATLRGMLLD
jgi:ATP-dependent DNA helicase Rep